MADESVASGLVLLRRVGVVAFALLAMGFVLLHHSVRENEELSLTIPWMMALVCAHFLALLWPRKIDVFSPVAMAWLFQGFVLLSELLLILNNNGLVFTSIMFLTVEQKTELMMKILSAYSLNFVFYAAGYHFGNWGQRFSRVLPAAPPDTIHQVRMMMVSLLCVGLAVSAYTYFQFQLDADLFDLSALGKGKTVWRNDPRMSWLHRGVYLGFVPILILFPRVIRGGNKFFLFLLTAGLFVGAALALRLGQRGPVATLLIVFTMMLHYLRKKIPIGVMLVSAIIGLMVLNTFGEFRRQSAYGGDMPVDPTEQAAMSPDQTLARHAEDRGRIDVLGVIFHYFPERQPYLAGRSWGVFTVMFVPRWIWPEKANYFLWRDTNIIPMLVGSPSPTPLLGVLYANFSWFGVVVGMFLWGVFHRGLYEWMLRRPKSPNTVLLYGLALLYVEPTSLNLAQAIQYIPPIYLFLRFVNTSSAETQPQLPAPAQARP